VDVDDIVDRVPVLSRYEGGGFSDGIRDRGPLAFTSSPFVSELEESSGTIIMVEV
jgi:hypothetical protein